MDMRSILAELYGQRDRITQAIVAIEAINTNGATSSRQGKGRPAGVIRRRHRISAAGRKRLSDMMKKRWAARRRQSKAA